MNRLLAIALLSIGLQLVTATRDNDIDYCLEKKGLKVETDKPLLESIGEPDSAEKLKDAPKDKLAGVIACVYKSAIDKRRSINDVSKSLINADDKLSEDQKKQMMDTLTDCNTKANGDDEQLLQCVKIIDAPFAKIGGILLDVPDQGTECFVENGLRTDEVFWSRKMKTSVNEVIQHVDEDKFSCGLACLYRKDQENHHPTISVTFAERVSEEVQKAELPEDQKKSMMDTIQKCITEAAGDDCKFMKCIKMFKPPFFDVLYAKHQ